MTLEIRRILTGEQHVATTRHPELFEQHPELIRPVLGGTDLDFPYLFYASDHGRVASYFASFPDVLVRNDGTTYRWAWNGNLFTHPAYRGRGLAKAIVEQQLKEFAALNYVWGGVFSSPSALRLYQRMGFVMVGAAKRLCLVRNIKPFLRHHSGNQILVEGAGFGYQGLFAVLKLALHRTNNFCRGFRVEQIDRRRFVSALFKHKLRLAEKFCWGDRSNWFDVRLGTIDKVFLIFRKNDIDPCGFLIARERLIKERPLKDKYKLVKLMSVMEFGRFDSGDDVSAALVDAALITFASTEADMLEFVTSSPEIEAAAKRRGFLSVGAGMSFKYMAPSNHPLNSIKSRPSDWHLSHYSGDAFGFE